VKSGGIGKHEFRILFGRDVQIELTIPAMPRSRHVYWVRGVWALSVLVRAGRQPWEQLQSVVGKHVAAFFAVQLCACLDLMAASDGEIPASSI
jgi:hypothetical protein